MSAAMSVAARAVVNAAARAVVNAAIGRLGARRWPGGLALALAAAALGSVRCADNPAVAPFGPLAAVELAVRMVDGDLAPAPGQAAGGARASSAAACASAPGFSDDLVATVSLAGPGGVPVVQSFVIPARTEQRALVIEGIAPGTGYRAVIRASAGGTTIFEGTSDLFTVLPAARTVASVTLVPQDRRATLGLGVATAQGDSAVAIPVFAAHALPVRGVQFDLCYDPGVLELVGARAAGARVGSFRGAGGEPDGEGVARIVLWSPDPSARIAPGTDRVLVLDFVWRPEAPRDAQSNVVFLNGLVTDEADSDPFTVYYFDGAVRR